MFVALACAVVGLLHTDALALQESDPGTVIGAGDTVFVTRDATELKLGNKTLKLLGSSTKMIVIDIDGDWIGGKVEIEGETMEGWVDRGALSLVDPAASKDTETPRAPSPAAVDDGPSQSSATERPEESTDEQDDAADQPAGDEPTGASNAPTTEEPEKKPAAQPETPTPEATPETTSEQTPAAEQLSSPEQSADQPPTGDQAAAAAASPEGPETLAEKFAQILAEQRARAATEQTTETQPSESPAEPESGAAPDREPAPAVAARVPVESQPPTIGVLVLRIPDNLADVPATEHIGQLILSGDRFTNRSLQQLEGLTVSALSIEAVNVTNVGLQYVSRMHGIRRLRLWSPGLDDEALQYVTQLDGLQMLDLEGTAVAGTTFEELKQLQNLETLILGPNTTDAEIALLKHLPRLHQLDLRACDRLTLACLQQLGSLTDLEVVWLPRHIRTKGKRALREILPQCQVRS